MKKQQYDKKKNLATEQRMESNLRAAWRTAAAEEEPISQQNMGISGNSGFPAKNSQRAQRQPHNHQKCLNPLVSLGQLGVVSLTRSPDLSPKLSPFFFSSQTRHLNNPETNKTLVESESPDNMISIHYQI